jgi:hypothetical protein
MATRSLLVLLTAAVTGRLEALHRECQRSGRHVIEAAEACHFVRGNQILILAISLLVLLKVGLEMLFCYNCEILLSSNARQMK